MPGGTITNYDAYLPDGFFQKRWYVVLFSDVGDLGGRKTYSSLVLSGQQMMYKESDHEA